MAVRDGAGERRPTRSLDERKRIVEEALASGVSVAAVARRHGLNANLIFKWIRRSREGPLVADRNPHKQSKFLPGTHIPVVSPEALLESQPDYVLILPWNLQDEIRRQLHRIKEWGGRFVTPVPAVRIYP